MAQDGAVWNRFGRSFAIDGDTLVGGARFDYDNRGVTSGSAHVFVRSGEWKHQAKLLAPDGAAYDYFGTSVAIYEEAIVVGAYGDDDNGYFSGSAHVFVRSGEVWNHKVKLLAPDGAANDEFGRIVSIYEDTIVAGARQDDGGSTHVFGINSGSAHGFVV